MTNWIVFALDNFGVCMFLLALILIIFHRAIRPRLKEAEIVYRWMAIFPLGFNALYAAFFHAFLPIMTAHNIGFVPSQFQYEVAIANLTMGILGIFSFNASDGFRLATVIAAACWLWGDAAVYIYQFTQRPNYTWMQIGSWFAIDIFVPIILFICIFNLRTKKSK